MADNWLSNAWEWIVPGEDDQGMFANIGDWWGGDDDYDDSVSIADFDQELIDELLGEIESAGGLDSFLPTQDIDWNNFIDWGDEDPAYSIDMNWLDEMPEETGIFSGDNFPGLAGFFNSLLGGANTAAGNVGSGLGGLFNSTLGQLAMLNYMKNKNKDYMDVPVGWGDGGGEGGSPIDYRVFNLQPALMPGVAYANVGKPEGMKGGGLGDITLARLEPGEFVMTKKATDNIGARNLYKLMKQAEGMG